MKVYIIELNSQISITLTLDNYHNINKIYIIIIIKLIDNTLTGFNKYY